MNVETQAEQLTLSVTVRDDARFANFFAGPNAQVVYSIQDQWREMGEPFIYLWGSQGVGCSHLLQAACHYAEGLGHKAVYLPLSELVSYDPSIFENLESLQLVALDDLDAITGKPEWEVALFHLFNRLRDSGTRMLVAAKEAPRNSGVLLPDLQSRLSWGITYQLESMADEEKIKALLLRARVRGLNVSEEVGRYILTRGPRDLTGLFDLLAELDQASLSAQRKLTKPFVKELLNW